MTSGDEAESGRRVEKVEASRGTWRERRCSVLEALLKFSGTTWTPSLHTQEATRENGLGEYWQPQVPGSNSITKRDLRLLGVFYSAILLGRMWIFTRNDNIVPLCHKQSGARKFKRPRRRIWFDANPWPHLALEKGEAGGGDQLLSTVTIRSIKLTIIISRLILPINSHLLISRELIFRFRTAHYRPPRLCRGRYHTSK